MIFLSSLSPIGSFEEHIFGQWGIYGSQRESLLNFLHQVCHLCGCLWPKFSVIEADMALKGHSSWFFHQVCHQWGHLMNKLLANEEATSLIGNPSWDFSSILSFMWFLMAYIVGDWGRYGPQRSSLLNLSFIKFFTNRLIWGINRRTVIQLRPSNGIPLGGGC